MASCTATESHDKLGERKDDTMDQFINGRSEVSKIDRIFISLADSRVMFWITMGLIALNSAVQAASSSRNSDFVEKYLDITSTVLNAMFGVELILNFRGFGINKLIRDKFRLFDTMAILLSIADVVYSKAYGNINNGISIIRTLSLIQMLKFTKVWPSLIEMYSSFVKSTKAIFSILIVLVIIVFIYAMLGNHLFRNKIIDMNLTVPAGSFQTIADSMLLVFVLLTGEGWPELMTNLMYEYKLESKFGEIIPIIYVFSFIILGNFIVLNIFLGIMIDQLSGTEKRFVKHENPKRIPSTNSFFPGNIYARNNCSNQNEESKLQREMKYCIDVKATALERANEVRCTNRCLKVETTERNGENNVKTTIKKDTSRITSDCSGTSIACEYEKDKENMLLFENQGSRRAITHSLLEWFALKTGHRDKGFQVSIPQHNSLLIFSPKSKIRKLCFWFTTRVWFSNLCLCSIAISTLLLALEDPLNKDSNFAKGLRYCDYIFTGMCLIPLYISKKIFVISFTVLENLCIAFIFAWK